MNTAVLYSPQVLALATSLANYPPLAGALEAEARSPTCGSTIRVTVIATAGGSIASVGLRAHACAIGQASAALFAQHAIGQTETELAAAERQIEDWLSGERGLPDWPGFAAIAAARDYPARHGAILLPWKAALAALSSATVPR